MTLTTTLNTASPPPDRPELVPQYFDTEMIATAKAVGFRAGHGRPGMVPGRL